MCRKSSHCVLYVSSYKHKSLASKSRDHNFEPYIKLVATKILANFINTLIIHLLKIPKQCGKSILKCTRRYSSYLEKVSLRDIFQFFVRIPGLVLFSLVLRHALRHAWRALLARPSRQFDDDRARISCRNRVSRRNK